MDYEFVLSGGTDKVEGRGVEWTNSPERSTASPAAGAFGLRDEQEEGDAYDYDVTGSGRYSGSAESKKRRERRKRRESRLTPRREVESSAKTTEERIAEILARTRPPAEAVGRSGPPGARGETDTAVSMARGLSGEYATSEFKGATYGERRPCVDSFLEAGATSAAVLLAGEDDTMSTGTGAGAGVFSDFAKSLREMRLGDLDLDGEAKVCEADGGLGSGSEMGSEGDGGKEARARRGQGMPGQDGAEDGARDVLGGVDVVRPEEAAGQSDSSVIDEANMEMGRYAPARAETRRSREASSVLSMHHPEVPGSAGQERDSGAAGRRTIMMPVPVATAEMASRAGNGALGSREGDGVEAANDTPAFGAGHRAGEERRDVVYEDEGGYGDTDEYGGEGPSLPSRLVEGGLDDRRSRGSKGAGAKESDQAVITLPSVLEEGLDDRGPSSARLVSQARAESTSGSWDTSYDQEGFEAEEDDHSGGVVADPRVDRDDAEGTRDDMLYSLTPGLKPGGDAEESDVSGAAHVGGTPVPCRSMLLVGSGVLNDPMGFRRGSVSSLSHSPPSSPPPPPPPPPPFTDKEEEEEEEHRRTPSQLGDEKQLRRPESTGLSIMGHEEGVADIRVPLATGTAAAAPSDVSGGSPNHDRPTKPALPASPASPSPPPPPPHPPEDETAAGDDAFDDDGGFPDQLTPIVHDRMQGDESSRGPGEIVLEPASSNATLGEGQGDRKQRCADYSLQPSDEVCGHGNVVEVRTATPTAAAQDTTPSFLRRGGHNEFQSVERSPAWVPSPQAKPPPRFRDNVDALEGLRIISVADADVGVFSGVGHGKEGLQLSKVSLFERDQIAESPVVGRASNDDGPWNAAASAPSLAELEYQLQKLSPLRASPSSPRRQNTRAHANPSTVPRRSQGSSSRYTGKIGGTAGSGRGGSKSLSVEREGALGTGRLERLSRGSGQGGLRGRSEPRSRLEPAERTAGVTGSGVGLEGDDYKDPAADLSSMVLVSSLSSTPGNPRSASSGKWAAETRRPRRPAKRRQGGESYTPKSEAAGVTGAGATDLEGARSELLETARNLQARELGVRLRELSAAQSAEENATRRSREAELETGRETAEKELEKARAEIYALKLRLEEKRSGTAPASTAKFPVAQNRPPGQGRGRARDVARGVSVEGAGARDEKTDDAEAREKEVQEAATVLKAEAENMRKEIAEQERLLQAYQKENERLLEKAKEDKLAHEEERVSLFRDRQRLNKELNRLTNQRGSRGGGEPGDEGRASPAQSSAFAVQARLEAEAALTEARQRESELMFEVDRLRTAKRNLETRVAVSMGTGEEAADADGSALPNEVRRLQELLAEEREAREEERRAARTKLDWYAENQEMVDRHLDEIRGQRKELDRLREALSKGGGKGRTATARSPSDIRRIKDLENQLSELAEALRRRNPDCLANLIRAACPSESQELRTEEQAKRVKELEAELAAQKSESETKMRALRQEHERVKTGLQKQLERTSGGVRGGFRGGVAPGTASTTGGVASSGWRKDRGFRSGADSGAGKGGLRGSADGGGGGGGGGGGAPGAHGVRGSQQQQQDRVAELEKEIRQVRAFYTRKLKEVERRGEAQLRALKRGGKSGADPGLAPPMVQVTAAAAAAASEIKTGDCLDEREAGGLSGSGGRRHEGEVMGREGGVKREYGVPQEPRENGRKDREDEKKSGEGVRSGPVGDGSTGGSAPPPPPPPVAGKADRVPPNGPGLGNSGDDPDGQLDAKPRGEDRGSGVALATSSPGAVSTGDYPSKFAGLLRAERARHQEEIEKERKSAEERILSLKLRLVETAQALGKAQAREQATSWRSGVAGRSDGSGGGTDLPPGAGVDLAAGRDGPDVNARAVRAEANATEARQRARILELEVSVAKERRATAVKELEQSEHMRCLLEAEVLGLRTKMLEPSTPSQLKYLELTRKVEEMETRTSKREAELRRVLEESRQQSRLELSRLQALHADELRAKDALVLGFREELDALLRAAGQYMTNAAATEEKIETSSRPGVTRNKGGVGGDAGTAGLNGAAEPVWGVVSS